MENKPNEFDLEKEYAIALGKKLKELRRFNSLYTIAEKTNGQISHSYLRTLEKGINPNNGQIVKPTPEKLKILADVYNIQYEELLKIRGYLKENIENKVEKLLEEYNKLSDEEKEQFLKLINK